MARRIEQAQEADQTAIETGDTCTTDDDVVPPQIWTATVNDRGYVHWSPEPWTLVRSKTAIRRSDKVVILDESLI